MYIIMKQKILIVRHGHREDGGFGDVDTPLSEIGKQEARNYGNLLSKYLQIR